MLLMSSSLVLSENFSFTNCQACWKPFYLHKSSNFKLLLGRSRSRLCGFIPNAKKNRHSRKRSWWQKLFFDEDGNWLGLKDDDMFENELDNSENEQLSDAEKFEAWNRRSEAIIELREARENVKNEDTQRWEDWLADGNNSANNSTWGKDWDNWTRESTEIVTLDHDELVPEKGLIESVRDMVLGREDDDLLYEDCVFRYGSINSANFLAVLIIVPWALDFVVHDYVLMPFLDRYVKKVPLAAQMLDVRRNQKLEMAKEIKNERARFRLEVEIGESPPLTDEELWWELRSKALELREKWRLENRQAFANIWSDVVFGISLFILLYCNQNKVALLKFTGYKIINNISDTGKAFLIILLTDIFLGYHSESGWQTLLEIFVDHYGVEVDQSSITIFICLIPVVIDACVKFWMFKFLPRLSPKVSNIFREMKRH